jgi:hypothetical protein
MADINLFQGGQGRAITSDCGCGPFPTQYPSPNRVAVHYKAQRFTLSDTLNPKVNTNKRCILCTNAPDAATQATNLIGKKIGILRIPPRHLTSALYLVADAGSNGAGLTFEVYCDVVNATTGAVIGPMGLPANLVGPHAPVPGTGTGVEQFATVSPASDGWFTDSTSVLEVGVIVKTAPTPSASLATMCQWDGHIDLIAKVDAFDYGNE